MANVTVTTSFSNVQVSESNANVINVTTSPSNITITSGSTVSQSVIRNALSNVAPITYDQANGVIGFESTSFTTDITTTANVTAAIFKGPGSNASSIAWNDNLELWNLQGNILRVANNAAITDPSSIDPGNAVLIGFDDFGGTPARANLNIAGNIIAGQGNSQAQFSVGDKYREIIFPSSSTTHGNIAFRKAGSPNSTALVIDFGAGETANIDMTKSNVKIGVGLEIVSANPSSNAILTTDGNITTTANVGAGNVIATKFFGSGSELTGIAQLTNAQAQAFIESNGLDANANITTTANVQGQVGIFTKTGTGLASLITTGNVAIGGNLNVTGNINSQTVTDLFVEDRNITLQFGQTGTPSANSHLFVDRGSSADSFIIWSEADDKWGISNDGSNVVFIATNTDSLTQGSTNKYYSNSLMIAGLGAQSTDFQIGDGAANISIGADTGNLWANVGNVRFGGNGIENTGTTFTISNASSNIHGVNNRFEIKSNIDGGGIHVLNTANPGSNVAHLIVGEDGANNSGIGPKQVRTSTVEHKITHIPVNLANSILTSNSNITTTANISGGSILGTFIGNITGNVTGAPSSLAGLTTANLAENTNLYYTNARADARITAYTGALANLTGNITTTANVSGGYFIGNGSTLTNISTETVAIVNDTSTDATVYPVFSPASSGDNALKVSDSKMFFNASSGELTVANGITTGLLKGTDSVASGASANLNLLGQQNGVHLNKTVDSVTSRILDVDTTGYAIAEPTLPATTTLGGFAPSALISINLTNGSNTATGRDLYGGALGAFVDAPALRGPGFSSAFAGGDVIFTSAVGGAPATSGNVEAAFTTAGIGTALGQKNSGLANVSANLYGQSKGWTVTNVSDTTELFPIGTFVTGMSGNAITFSQNATGATGIFSIILSPGIAQTTDANTQLKYQTTVGSANNVINAGSLYGKLGSFEHAETLANLTYDAVSYGNTSTIGFTAVGTKHSADMVVGTESASRYPRLLTVGPSTTPDPFSGRVTTNSPTPIGVTVEDDGHTYAGNNAPYSKFLFNSYTGNFDSLTALPNYATVGSTGNATLDIPQLKAPSLQFKTFRGAKNTANTTSYLMQTGEVVGKVSFSPGQTTGSGFQGADLINPPSAITVDVGSANINTGAANAHMHITTSPYPSSIGYFRNNTNADLGINQQTNFTTKDGNLTLAAQTTGMITLAPTPDYGDGANSTVWTRFAGTTHAYHTFLDAKFLTSKQGTLVEIQPKSGTTTGGGGLQYDSSGDSTLRLSSHHANSVVKAQWDITNDESESTLIVRDHTNSATKLEFSALRTEFSTSAKLKSYTTTQINALSSPEAGDLVFNTTLSLICVYNGSAWRKINDAAM